MARDIIINILGYRDLNAASWWKTIKNNTRYVNSDSLSVY